MGQEETSRLTLFEYKRENRAACEPVVCLCARARVPVFFRSFCEVSCLVPCASSGCF